MLRRELVEWTCDRVRGLEGRLEGALQGVVPVSLRSESSWRCVLIFSRAV